ncbi:MAG: 1-acyl-sn-glycerol-3-phosphate acyltransferase [Saprospiraceae bacterium]
MSNEPNIKKYPHLLPNLEDWPIYKFSQDRDSFIKKVSNDVIQFFSKYSPEDLDQTLAKTIYQEKQRIKSNPWKADPPNEMQFFRKLQNEYNDNHQFSNKTDRNIESVSRLIKRYTIEITGQFNHKTFLFARKLLTLFFHTMFYPLGKSFFKSTAKKREQLLSVMRINGEIDQLRLLSKDHTIVMVPTHSSNLDSILVGYMIDSITGLPAFSYGAGLNLYDSEFFGFFMNRLGAYRVDRRKKNLIYLQTLSSYSKLSVMRGVHTIFFPGGTRSRSGEIENKLKLGLLNSLLLAQRQLIEKNESRKIVLVPVVLTYESVLEARSLILQHLKSTGQEKYTARDRASSIGQYFSFIRRFLTKGSHVYMSFGKPMDVFGNYLTDKAESIGHSGKIIDLKDYFIRQGDFVIDSQRESIYTKELGEKIVEQFNKSNYILPAHLVAYCAFQLLIRMNPGQDIYSLVQLPEEEFAFPKRAFKQLCKEVIALLIKLNQEDKLILPELLTQDLDVVIEDGIRNLGIYHIKRPLVIDQFKRLISEDFLSLLFYHNKLSHLKLEDMIIWDHISLVQEELAD